MTDLELETLVVVTGDPPPPPATVFGLISFDLPTDLGRVFEDEALSLERFFSLLLVGLLFDFFEDFFLLFGLDFLELTFLDDFFFEATTFLEDGFFVFDFDLELFFSSFLSLDFFFVPFFLVFFFFFLSFLLDTFLVGGHFLSFLGESFLPIDS